ncbi:RING/U-box superfamily protein [Striga asiatica]|uniref:RING-type E3 ubiquitin transferase n=1 Tax=Striga asiatica TaxID=4170 RepID=A0A5A7P152_STRAF|nr:RING/U-box superfamily protein [Striga asiatica]
MDEMQMALALFFTRRRQCRLWIVGYAVQLVLHVVCVWSEYKKRNSQRDLEASGRGHFVYSRSYSDSSLGSDESDTGGYFFARRKSDDEASFAKHLESAYTMLSFIWWVTGFYWESAGGQNLTTESPQLYWLCITSLAFDVFFVVVCVAVACVVGLAEGATKEDIERLPRCKFQKISDLEKQSSETEGSYGGIMTECNSNSPTEHVLPQEDAECCICLSAYDDGAELREVPCGHHFHSACIDKWLYINATCPLCKFNILKNGNQDGSEKV